MAHSVRAIKSTRPYWVLWPSDTGRTLLNRGYGTKAAALAKGKREISRLAKLADKAGYTGFDAQVLVVKSVQAYAAKVTK